MGCYISSLIRYVISEREGIDDVSTLIDLSDNVGQEEQPLFHQSKEEPQVIRSTRTHHQSTRYSSFEYVIITEESESQSFQEI